jgi:hypothetical protein
MKNERDFLIMIRKQLIALDILKVDEIRRLLDIVTGEIERRLQEMKK